MYCRSEICIATLKYLLPKYVIQTACSRAQTITIIWAPPHEWVHNGLVPVPRHLTVLPSYCMGSHCVPLLNCTHLAKSFEHAQNFGWVSPGLAGSRRPLMGHQRVHRSLNAPPCALTVFHRLHEIYHGRLSRHHVTATSQ